MRIPFLVLLAACSDYELSPDAKHLDAPAPDIEVTPSSLNFTTVEVGCTAEQLVTIRNVGEATLLVERTSLEGDPGFGAEVVTTTLEPGEGAEMRVTFALESPGSGRAQVVVQSNDPDEGVSEVPSVGTGIVPGPASDTFTQQADPVDVLWVIDNSSSMGQEQARVIAEISAFFTWFETLKLDYHMGVVATDIVDPSLSGRLVGSPAYIDNTTPNAEAELAEAINVGTDDMGDESGLAAAELALSEPLLSAENAGFIRPGARLAVVFLSDEPEQSPADAQHYIDFFSALKADPDHLLVASIVGDYATGCSSVCDDTEQTATPGDKYIDVTTAFDGIFGSICTCDLSPTLDQIGMKSTLFSRTYPLSQPPSEPTEIRVWLDGVETAAWSYDAVENEVVLDDAPVNGTVVDVEYPIGAACD